MAIYIPITKTDEDDHTVTYQYERKEHKSGTSRGCCVIDKKSGEIVRVSGEEWDAHDFYFSRVRLALEKHWEKREFPDATWYAA